jgi:type III secretory pathway component EscU
MVMDWVLAITLSMCVVVITLGSMLYGYLLAYRQMKRDREKIRKQRMAYKNSDTPVYDRLMDDFYDVT